MAKAKEILLGVTGSIAAYKAGDLIRRLQDAGFGVTVIMTRGAEEFITPLTLSSLSGRPVYRDMFKSDDWMAHIGLAQKSDLFLIAPATANTIGKLANGIADDLLSSTVLATEAKILIAPAMNDVMYKNKIVQGNIAKLKETGVGFVEPVFGKLACGTAGEGHLADIEGIVKAVLYFLKK